MGKDLEGRLRKLEEGTPGGYCTYAEDGTVLIDSPLPAGDWLGEALRVLQGRDCPARRLLLVQLSRSARSRGGDLLFEYLWAMYANDERTPR